MPPRPQDRRAAGSTDRPTGRPSARRPAASQSATDRPRPGPPALPSAPVRIAAGKPHGRASSEGPTIRHGATSRPADRLAFRPDKRAAALDDPQHWQRKAAQAAGSKGSRIEGQPDRPSGRPSARRPAASQSATDRPRPGPPALPSTPVRIAAGKPHGRASSEGPTIRQGATSRPADRLGLSGPTSGPPPWTIRSTGSARLHRPQDRRAAGSKGSRIDRAADRQPDGPQRRRAPPTGRDRGRRLCQAPRSGSPLASRTAAPAAKDRQSAKAQHRARQIV